MNRRTLGLTGIIVMATATTILVIGIVVLQALHVGMSGLGFDVTAAAPVRGAVVTALVWVAVVCIGAAALAGRALARALADLRAAVLARARGDMESPLPQFRVTELSGIASAIDRLSARDAAREADARREGTELSVLLDAISEGILRVDEQGRLLRSNAAARKLLGLGEHTHGQPASASIRNAELRRLLGVAAGGQPIIGAEFAIDDRRLLVSAHPVAGTSDSGGGAVVAFLDLTEIRRLESVRRDFVANVSHELKTPLTSIRGYAETLLNDEDLPAEVRRQFLEVVHKNAGRLQHIVDDLLDLSRLESGGWRPEPHDVDVLTLVSDVWTGCSERARQRSVNFVPPTESHSVRADPGGLRQVLSNLFDNALRYTPDGGCIRVATCAPAPKEGAAFVLFEIRDSGAGIPSDALPRIFERFYRADPARSRAEGGTGLGLSIVKHLIDRMGGDITAESELGKGTTIRFRLPAAT